MSWGVKLTCLEGFLGVMNGGSGVSTGSKILRAEEIGQIRPAIYIELKPGVVKKTRDFSITKSTFWPPNHEKHPLAGNGRGSGPAYGGKGGPTIDGVWRIRSTKKIAKG